MLVHTSVQTTKPTAGQCYPMTDFDVGAAGDEAGRGVDQDRRIIARQVAAHTRSAGERVRVPGCYWRLAVVQATWTKLRRCQRNPERRHRP